MTSRERMLTALGRGVPDRLPATVHQWLDYHRNKYLGGMTALEAFRKFRLDAAITFIPNQLPADDANWRVTTRHSKTPEGNGLARTTVTTPGGVLTETSEGDSTTAWIVERMVKRREDVELLRKYMPVPRLDRDAVRAMRKDLGDDGILRGGGIGHQFGPWQDACCLYGTEEMILETFDHPDWVREFLDVLTQKRLLYIERELAGAEFDLIETGGGAASSTVISPAIFRDFCLPVDRKIHDALHAAGHKVVYHTCGGMMPILELIAANGCDAAETLSPPEVGGDARPAELNRRIGGELALIGGFNQFQVLSEGTHEEIRRSVQACFKTYGAGGGYIMSPSDHFFETPLENLYCYSDAARECVYR